ncbi:SGNH/GDSL hydrolase family protein [Microbacterium sp. NPDC056569]|uniref:SGNH/GDSL hydrolase family protein n=1 Tax=Microbacterium sp. NPDC056569 TaxID=3345867 RepID=UPI003670BCB8
MTSAASTLVFVGDSITDAGRDRSDVGSLGDGFVRLVADELGREEASVRVVNVGIAGNRAVDLARRWDQDVAPHGADVLTLFVGVNDMWRRFDQDDPTSAEDFEATYRRMIAAADAARGLVLMEPFFLPAREEQREWLGDLDPKRDVVRRLAEEAGAVLVPLHGILSAVAEREGVAAVAPDGVHPTARGSRLIADAWLDAYESLSRRD